MPSSHAKRLSSPKDSLFIGGLVGSSPRCRPRNIDDQMSTYCCSWQFTSWTEHHLFLLPFLTFLCVFLAKGFEIELKHLGKEDLKQAESCCACREVLSILVGLSLTNMAFSPTAV